MPDRRLTAVIPSYNGRHLLEGALPSFRAQRYADFQIVVVDDGSTDDTVEWLSLTWPGVDVLRLPKNVGVTAALNRGCNYAKTELVGLFNNDIELDRDCLGELVAALDAHVGAGSAAPKLVDFYSRDMIDGAGDIFFWQGTGWRRGHGEIDHGQYEDASEIFGACAGAAIYRRAALDVVGAFDEDYFAFFEDVDWAFRAQLAGFSCQYVPTAVVYHMGSATLGKGLTDFTRYHLWRNAIWMVAKDYPVGSLVRHAPALIWVQAANFAVAARDRKLGVWWRSLRDAVRGLPRAVRKRRAVQRTRRRSVPELERVVATGK